MSLVAPPLLHKALLIEFATCALPLPFAFFFGKFAAGGLSFIGLLLAWLVYHAFRKEPFHFTCLIASAIPLMVFVRGAFIPFNSLVVLLSWGLLAAALARAQFSGFWRRKTLLYTVVGSVAFWWVSFLRSGNYESNLRALEWSFSAAVVFMLSERRSYLYTAMLGWGISVVTAGLMLLPYGDRLGMADIDGVTLGNPILLGLPAALVLLLSIADQGRWLLLDGYPSLRVLLGCIWGLFLVFSTSRGSWIVALVGLLILFIFERRTRMPMAAFGLLLGSAMLVFAGSSHMQSARHYLLKTISPDVALGSKTTGRSEQWQAFPAVLGDSPVWGFGPGSGRAVAYAYSGANLQWHSVYLQVGAEMGILGLTILFLLLGTLIRDGIKHFADYDEIVPLLGTIAFMMYGLSVSGFDSLGGILLGLGFLGGHRSNLWVVRTERFHIVSAYSPGRDLRRFQA